MLARPASHVCGLRFPLVAAPTTKQHVGPIERRASVAQLYDMIKIDMLLAIALAMLRITTPQATLRDNLCFQRSPPWIAINPIVFAAGMRSCRINELAALLASCAFRLL